MKAVAFSPAAAADLDDIWDYTAAHWSPDQADRYLDSIHEACRSLAAGVKTSRAVDIRPGYSKCAAGAHMIYFRDRQDRIEIIRVLHQRMDADRHL